MSAVTETKTTYYCDLCNGTCTPVQQIKETTGFAPIEGKGVSLIVTTFGSDAMGDRGDVCSKCVAKAMRQWLAANGGEK
jgi:hypothetical protein